LLQKFSLIFILSITLAPFVFCFFFSPFYPTLSFFFLVILFFLSQPRETLGRDACPFFFLFSFFSFLPYPFFLLSCSSFLFVPTEREIKERPREKEREIERDGENQKELEGGMQWASHRLGRTTAPGPMGHGSTPVRP
jgi:hypothetical protein